MLNIWEIFLAHCDLSQPSGLSGSTTSWFLQNFWLELEGYQLQLHLVGSVLVWMKLVCAWFFLALLWCGDEPLLFPMLAFFFSLAGSELWWLLALTTSTPLRVRFHTKHLLQRRSRSSHWMRLARFCVLCFYVFSAKPESCPGQSTLRRIQLLIGLCLSPVACFFGHCANSLIKQMLV